jgi:hypothetical protein
MVISAASDRCSAPAMRSMLAMSSFNGNNPFWNGLSWKMSPKLGAMTQRMPASISDQTAVSRELPQPKLGPARMMRAWA